MTLNLFHLVFYCLQARSWQALAADTLQRLFNAADSERSRARSGPGSALHVGLGCSLGHHSPLQLPRPQRHEIQPGALGRLIFVSLAPPLCLFGVFCCCFVFLTLYYNLVFAGFSV